MAGRIDHDASDRAITFTGIRTKRTAHRDLTDLVAKGVFQRVGTTGKGTTYTLAKGATKGPRGSAPSPGSKGATKGPNGPSRLAPGKIRRRANPLAGRQELAKADTRSSPRVRRRAKRPESRPKGLTKGSRGSSPRELRKRDKNGTNGT